MEDKRKLTAAIIGAITAYLQMEKISPATSGVKPEKSQSVANSPEDGSKQ